jgi:hypothetical protein
MTNFSLSKCEIGIAKAALTQCIPNASILPDKLFQAAEAMGIPVRFEKIDEFESLSKEELFEMVFQGVILPQSQVFIIADLLLPNFALTYKGSNLSQAVMAAEQFLFDHDLLFVWPEIGFVTVVHHEGGYFHIRQNHDAFISSNA